MQSIHITLHPITIGEWLFDEAPRQLHGLRTADGVKVQIPSVLRLRWLEHEQRPRPTVTNLHVSLYVVEADDSKLCIGDLRDWNHYQGGVPDTEHSTNLEWYGSMAALQRIEKSRNGGPIRLFLECTGQGSFAYYNVSDMRPIMSEPHRFSGRVHVTYSRDLWLDMLRRLGATSNVLVEFPLSSNPPTPWDTVWGAVAEAREQLETGGTTNWGNCIRSVRLALEKWQEIDPVNKGPTDKRARSKEQRLDNLRWHLLQVAHLAAHTPTEKWNRKEAALLLGTLSGLLAVRDP